MNASMINAMVSMSALQRKLDTIADNVANINTVGYKRKESSFEDLFHNVKQQPEDFRQSGRMTPLDFNQSWGVRMTPLQIDLSQGPLSVTDVPTDLAIEGNALFEVAVDDAGNRGYTRSGAFQLTLDANGDTILATGEGYPIVAYVADDNGDLTEGRVIVPNGYRLRVDEDGAAYGVSDDNTIALGTIKLVQVVRPGSLTPVDDNLFALASGANAEDVLTEVLPDADNRPALRQGFLEQTNVQFADEVTELINVQRAYQLAARALSSSDSMMGIVNTMRA